MEKLKKTYSLFKEWLKNLDTKQFADWWDTAFKEYLLHKNIELENFKSDIELKNYLQDYINFFKTEALWNEIAEKIWVNYCKSISITFHQKIDNLIIEWFEWDDFYEEVIKRSV